MVLLLFLLYIVEFFSILENKLIGYADDSTLSSVMTSPSVRVTVAESLNRDSGKVGEWCDLWVMKLYVHKTYTNSLPFKSGDYDSLQVKHNAFPVTPLTIGGSGLK